MKKWIIKTIIFIVVFLTSIIVISKIMNKGNLDLTMEVEGASNPCAYVMLGGERSNAMFGYAKAMDTETLKQHITPLDSSRTVSLEIDTFGARINKVSYEVRSVDGSRLVESTQVFNYTERNNLMRVKFSVKDLIQENMQYTLVLLLEKEGGEVLRYYTRIIQSEKYHLQEQLEFARDFHKATFDKNAAAIITDHVESNSKGDNTTYAFVNIHSKVDQITWGNLKLKSVTDPVYQIVEIGTETASIMLRFMVTIEENGNLYTYPVEEFFRTRFTADRIYLLEYEREMNQLIESSNLIVANDKVMLGISTGDVSLVENASGTIVAFEANHSLYSFSVSENKLAVIYSPYETAQIDYRTVFAEQKIKVLYISETGNITYMVYGHFNQGINEGLVGIQIYNYDSTTNTIEQKAFIPYSRSESVLMAEMEQMAYVNVNNVVFFILDNNLYRVDLNEISYKIVASDMMNVNYECSDDYSMIAWQVDGDEKVSRDPYACSKLMLYNLTTEEKTSISAKADSYIMPLGFMGKDLIYGHARKEDIMKDNTGKLVFPMYRIEIQDENGNVLKEYQMEGVYVTAISLENNLISLTRVKMNDTKTAFLPTNDDQIICSELETPGKNSLITVATENYEKIHEIALTKSVSNDKTLVLTPKEVIVEEMREISLDLQKKTYERYYVRGRDGVAGIYTDPAKAVQHASDIAGVVTDDSGQYIWKNGNRLISNQIMAIETVKETEEKSSVAVCLEAMLSFEGITRSTERLLKEGQSVTEILINSMPEGTDVLNLTGCSLSAVLYYVNAEYPVMALLNDGSAVLIVGYNQQNTVIMNPKTGTCAKKGMNDSKEWFEDNGNVFITYVQK